MSASIGAEGTSGVNGIREKMQEPGGLEAAFTDRNEEFDVKSQRAFAAGRNKIVYAEVALMNIYDEYLLLQFRL